jgi:hypothetical protein
MGKKRGESLFYFKELRVNGTAQLKATLAALEADLEDLDESVKYMALPCPVI